MCKSAVLLSLVLSVGLSSAAEVTVGWRENAGCDVAAGETVQQTDLVTVDAFGSFIKTGAGTLEMPLGTVDERVPSTVKVLAGTLKLTTATPPARDTATPPAVIAEQAAFWVDATAGQGLVVTNGATDAETGVTPAYATAWLDCRETNPASPTRFYAVPAWTNNTSSPLWGVPPAVTTVDGRRAVYFGGAYSGQYMSFRKGGAYRILGNIYDYFLVIGVTNSLGLALGVYGDGQAAFFRTGTSMTTTFFYPRSDVGCTGYGARHYLDGRVYDPYAQMPVQGFQLLGRHAEEIVYASNADAFFNGYANNKHDDGTVGNAGGDYLCEAIIFTNAIPETVRTAVERYLMAKWNLPARFEKTECVLARNTLYAVASNAAVEVSVPAGAYARGMRLAGEGTVTKTGEGTLVLGPSGDAPFTGAFDLRAGGVFSQGGPLPPLCVAAGSRLTAGEYNTNGLPVLHTAEYEAGAGTLTSLKADAPADTVVKDGLAPARIREIKPGVKRLNVTAGQLVLEGGVIARTLAADGAISAFVTNHNFEIPVPLRVLSDSSAAYRNHGAITAETGWTPVTGVQNSMILTSVNNGYGGNAWSTWCKCPCPEGTNVLYFIGQGGAYTTVTFPKSGYYRFSALAAARGSSYARNICDVFLGATYETRQSFGVIMPGYAAFRRYYCRTPYVEAGVPYVFGVKTRKSFDSGLALDDFRLDYIPEADCDPAACVIPNGNFDDLVNVASLIDPNATNSTANWTLTTEMQGKWQKAQIVFPSTRITNGRTFTLSDDVWNTAQLMLYSGGWAETTFTPPAGTYRLRGRVARWRGTWSGTTINGSPTVAATAAIGSVTNALGSVASSSELLTEKRWPAAFTADGTTPVTVRLTCSSCVALLDDFDLVAVDSGDDELLAETACESWTAWTTLNPAAPALGNGAVQGGGLRRYDGVVGGLPYGFYWGYNRYAGDCYLWLCENGGAQQNVTIPKAGIYRLVYHERSRLDGNGYNPIRAWIRNKAGTYTNFIARSTHHVSTNFVEYAYHFRLPAAGEYVLAFQGTGWNWQNRAKEDLESIVDGVSLKYEQGTLVDVPSVPENLAVTVAKDAILNLNYPGTLKIRSLRLGGTFVRGCVDASTHPEYLTGMGALDVRPAGALLLIR